MKHFGIKRYRIRYSDVHRPARSSIRGVKSSHLCFGGEVQSAWLPVGIVAFAHNGAVHHGVCEGLEASYRHSATRCAAIGSDSDKYTLHPHRALKTYRERICGRVYECRFRSGSIVVVKGRPQRWWSRGRQSRLVR